MQMSSQSASRHPNRGPARRGLEGLGGPVSLMVHLRLDAIFSQEATELICTKNPTPALLPCQEIYSCLPVLYSLTTHVLLEPKHSVRSFSGGWQSIVHIKIIHIPELMFPSRLIKLFIVVHFIFPK